jgi:hypothetical protein
MFNVSRSQSFREVSHSSVLHESAADFAFDFQGLLLELDRALVLPQGLVSIAQIA